MADLREYDLDIFQAIEKEKDRQNNKIELIASENFVSDRVMEAMGSVMTNKYAEGYPNHRYYGGCQYVDIAEDIARERAKKIFKCQYANVQPHSGSQANMAALMVLANPGDTVMGMDLSMGGHLTHGSPVNFSGRLYNIVSYGVNKDGFIDYEEVQKIAERCQPKVIIAGASAYPRMVDFKKFREIADSVGAYLMSDMAHIAGLVAAGLHVSPLEYSHVVTTTTHKTLRGPRGGMILTNEVDLEVTLKNTTKPKKLPEALDFLVFPGIQGGPLMHVIAAKAVSFKEALSEEFKGYQQQVIKNAKALAKALENKGFHIVSGGTDNHIVLLDISDRNFSGKAFEKALGRAGITTNKNMVPFDKRSPMKTSGIRLGTPAATTKGMLEKDMIEIADFIYRIANDHKNEELAKEVLKDVMSLSQKYPLYK